MVSVGAVVTGFILAIIFTVLLSILGVGSVLGLPVALVGFLVAGIGQIYFIIFVTTPEPTVFPPSLIANLPFSSKATGTINLTVKLAVSPGITISVPAGKVTSPVISDVLM